MELDESFDWLQKLTPDQYRAASLPFADYGFVRTYVGKDKMLFLLRNAPLRGSGAQPWLADNISPVEIERTVF
jgi:hypothetical protein